MLDSVVTSETTKTQEEVVSGQMLEQSTGPIPLEDVGVPVQAEKIKTQNHILENSKRENATT